MGAPNGAKLRSVRVRVRRYSEDAKRDPHLRARLQGAAAWTVATDSARSRAFSGRGDEALAANHGDGSRATPEECEALLRAALQRSLEFGDKQGEI